MNEIPFYSMMSIPVAEQRSSRREQIRLASPGVLMRTLNTKVSHFVESVKHAFSVASQEAVFCEYNPAECRGIA